MVSYPETSTDPTKGLLLFLFELTDQGFGRLHGGSCQDSIARIMIDMMKTTFKRDLRLVLINNFTLP